MRSSQADILHGPVRPLGDGPWWEPFARRAREMPRHTALVTDAGKWTFAALDEGAGRLAALFAGRGIGPGNIVACLLGRSDRAVTVILALARLGTVYLPLDAHAPGHRIREIVRDAGPAAVLSDLDDPPDAGTGRWSRLGAPERTALVDPGCLLLAPGLSDQPCGTGPVPGYIIYTSGSTGLPKGVAVGGASLANLYGELQENYFGLPGRKRSAVAHGMALSFDASWDPFLWMLGGHELHLLGEDIRVDPERYVHEIRRRGLNVVEAVPSLVDAMVDEGLLAADTQPDLLLMGGEAIGGALWSRLREVPAMTSVNLYGPTEGTVFATACRLDEHPTPSIGRPIANTRIRLVDPEGNQVAPGEDGELWLGGANVALGYWRRPELTVSKFVTGPDGRRYRTGDLCRQLPDDRLEFRRRLDNQVKIRGLRVEPGEAEQVLLASPDVRQAVVVPSGEGGDRRLVAYVVTDANHAGAVDDLRGRLREQLPGYLVPAKITLVSQLPLTPYGKIDRSALAAGPEPVAVRAAATSAAAVATVPPRTLVERTIAEQWRQVLGSTVIDVHEDFFDAGGHSLRAAQLAVRLRELGLPCELEQVLEHPTIARLAAQFPSWGAGTSPEGS